MPRQQIRQDRVMAQVEELVPIYHQAVQDDRAREIPLLQQKVAEMCGPHLTSILMNLIGRYYAEKSLYKSALDKKQELLNALLAAPRRVVKLLGRITECVADETDQSWAIVEGPPYQAVRFSDDVDPDEVCAGLPEKTVWVWLVESMGAMSVAGRIAPPLLLNSGMERVMVYDGPVEEGDDALVEEGLEALVEEGLEALVEEGDDHNVQ
jgi:hypothetical protein